MDEFETESEHETWVPPHLIPSRAIIYLRYEKSPEKSFETSDDEILYQALRQLENNAAHIAGTVTESADGTVLPNAWNPSCIAGPLGSPLAHAISTRPEVVGLGEDRNGQLLVAASMSGVIGFYAPRSSETVGRGRLCFLGHDVRDVRHSWMKSLEIGDEILELYEADDDFDLRAAIADIVPRAHLVKGRFWDTVHFDARTNYALAIREFEKAGIEIIPTEDVITDECREAALLAAQTRPDGAAQQKFQEIRASYRMPVDDGIILLPTSGLPAPAIRDWPLSVGRYDPDPFETIMPVVLGNYAMVTVPNGHSAEGLPMGLTIAAPVHLTARLLALAEWFCRTTRWPTLARV
ncbi:MAG: hypothetical protein QM636_09160 [Rhizobium sp.]